MRMITVALSTECSLNVTECLRKVETQVQIRPKFARVEVQPPLPWKHHPVALLDTVLDAWFPCFEQVCVCQWKCNFKLKYFGETLMSQCEGRLVFLPRLCQSSKLIGFIMSLEGHKLWKSGAGKLGNVAVEKHPQQLYSTSCTRQQLTGKSRKVRNSVGMGTLSSAAHPPPKRVSGSVQPWGHRNSSDMTFTFKDASWDAGIFVQSTAFCW